MSQLAQFVVDGVRTPCAPQIIHSGTPTTIASGSRYHAFPVAMRLPDGRVLAAWVDYENHYGGSSPAARYAISTNATGTTWGAPQHLHSEAGHLWAPSGIARLGNRLAIMLNRNSPRRGYVIITTNPASWPAPNLAREIDWGQERYPAALTWIDDGTTDGLMLATGYGLTLGIRVAASRDAGITWTPHAQLDHLTGFTECHITQTARGDLLMLARVDSGPLKDTIQALRSTDEGATWTDPVTVIMGASGHPMTTLLSDGRLVVTLRDKLRQQTGGVVVSGGWSLGWSDDHGATWQVTPVLDERMMYGQVTENPTNGSLLLVGSTETASDRAHVWARPIHELLPTVPGMPIPLVRDEGDGHWSTPFPATIGPDGIHEIHGPTLTPIGRTGLHRATWPRERTH